MKRLIILSCLLTVSILLFSQKSRIQTLYVNNIQYPEYPLEGSSLSISTENMGIGEEYGITESFIDETFSKLDKFELKYDGTQDYNLIFTFEKPSAKNMGVKKKSLSNGGGCVGILQVNFPIYVEMVNHDGWTIINRHLISPLTNIETPSKSTSEKAAEYFKNHLKKSRKKMIGKAAKKNIEGYFKDFSNYHDINFYKQRVNYHYLKPKRKFKDERYIQNLEKVKSIFALVEPGETLADYKEEIMPIINFHKEEYNKCDYDNRKHKKQIYTNAYNLIELYTLLHEFNKVSPYYKFTQVSSYYRNTPTTNTKRIEKIEYLDSIHESGYTIDKEKIALAIKKHKADSIKHSPSFSTIYFNNGQTNKTLANIAYIRPYVDHSSNIVDLDYGRYLKTYPDPLNLEKYERISSDDVKKIVAGKEVYYPVKFDNNKNKLFSMVFFETSSIKLLAQNKKLIFIKSTEESGKSFSQGLFLKKNLKNYFEDQPEIVDFIENNNIEYNKTKDYIELAKRYSEL
jgi:hypothetical protein